MKRLFFIAAILFWFCSSAQDRQYSTVLTVYNRDSMYQPVKETVHFTITKDTIYVHNKSKKKHEYYVIKDDLYMEERVFDEGHVTKNYYEYHVLNEENEMDIIMIYDGDKTVCIRFYNKKLNDRIFQGITYYTHAN